MVENCLQSDIAEISQRLGPAAQDLAGKTVLLTGGCGFLGRYFTRVFADLNRHHLAKPCRVIVLDNLVTSDRVDADFSDLPEVSFVEHDVIEPFDCDATVDYVVHAAGIASPFYYRSLPLETLGVTVTGTRNMLDLARRDGARFTFFSSSEIYGDPHPDYLPTKESYRGNVSCRGPRACYDESKRVGETLCYIYHEYHGLTTTVIRPFNVYGPGMHETDYRVLPNFTACIQAGKPVSIYGAGSQTRTFCYVTDAMVGFLLTLLGGAGGEAYNIGNPAPEISMLDLVLKIREILGRDIAYEVTDYPDSYPADEPNRRCPDIGKARHDLQYAPEVGLDEGLGRFLAWTTEAYGGSE